jgi:hypothetical protein
MTYPDERFLKHWDGEVSEEALRTVDDTNKPGNRPAKQSQLRVEAIDDIYPDGRPYRGAGKLEGKTAWMCVAVYSYERHSCSSSSGGDSGIGKHTGVSCRSV